MHILFCKLSLVFLLFTMLNADGIILCMYTRTLKLKSNNNAFNVCTQELRQYNTCQLCVPTYYIWTLEAARPYSLLGGVLNLSVFRKSETKVKISFYFIRAVRLRFITFRIFVNVVLLTKNTNKSITYTVTYRRLS